MGRSVNYLSNATKVYYIFPHEDWDLFIEDISEGLKSVFPSLSDCDRWDNEETKIFLENQHTEIGVSEYCGLVSISLRPIEVNYQNQEGLSERWIRSIDKKMVEFFKPYNVSRKVGSFSNGEGVFEFIQ